MRLTLRTMLAYLDEILEPEDAEDIGHKIEESEFASGLVHRTRDTMRRLRLGAPSLTGRGMAQDPNSVAEYLDNTLAAERVPDFEKVCLESDVHLAEVASCHQILTLVLGEPADVDPESRERMYGLIHRPGGPEAPPVAGAGAAVAAPPVHTEVTVVKRARREVPDYLREPRSRLWPVLATLLIAAALAGGTFFFLSSYGPPGVRDWANGLLAKNTVADKQGDETSTGPSDESSPTDATDAAVLGAADQEITDKAATEPDANVVDDTPPADNPPADIPAGDDPAADITSDGTATPARSDVRFPATGRVPAPDAEDAAPPEPSDLGPPAPVGDEPDPDMAADDADAPEPGSIDVNIKSGDDPTGKETLTLTGAKDLGRYLSERDVLLVHDRQSDGWLRLKPRDPVIAGDRLLSLPAFRSSVTLGAGLTIQPVGPTQVDLLPLDGDGVPAISIAYGKVIMLTLGKAGNRIRLQLGEIQGLLTFVDPDATLAVEVHRVLVPGRDPEAAPALWAAELFAQSGKITWSAGGQTADGAATELTGPARISLTELAMSDTPPGEFPKWITTDGLTDLEKRGAAALVQELTTDRAVSLSLKELSESPRKEVRSLAIRSLAYVGKFEPFIAALNDPDQRLSWPGQIEALKASIARGPEVATQVRAAFEKQRGAEGQALYRMLWGYSADDLKKGADAQLVDSLSNKSLDFRVLGYWNLQNITGLPTPYRPDYTDVKRKPQALKWKQKLDEGKIVPMAAAPPKAAPAAKGAKGAAK